MSQLPVTTPVSSDNVISINKGGNTSPAEKEFKNWLWQLINKTADLKVMKGMPIDETFSALCVVIQEEILDDDVDDVKLDDILYDKTFEDSKYVAITILQKRLDAQKAEALARAREHQQQVQQAKKSKADALAAKARAKAGFSPPSADVPDELQKYKVSDSASAKHQNGANFGSHDSGEVPDAVLQLQQDVRYRGWPKFVFEQHDGVRNGRTAQGFRSWCVRYAQRQVDMLLNQQGLPDDVVQRLQVQKNRLSTYAHNCKRVIEAWGLSYKNPNDWANDGEEMWVLEQLKTKYPTFFVLSEMPKWENPEVKSKKDAEEQHMRALQSALKARLLVTNPGMTDDTAGKLATRTARNKAEKFAASKGYGEEILKEIFTEVAINRLDVADTDANAQKDKVAWYNTTMLYANAAGMTEEDLVQALMEFRQQRADKAAKDSATVAETRGAKFGESAKVPEKKKGDEGGNKKGKKRVKKGAKPDDAAEKPVKPTRGKR